MELCPLCERMSSERNHYTRKLVCYNNGCGYKEGYDKQNDEVLKLGRKDLYSYTRQVEGERQKRLS